MISFDIVLGTRPEIIKLAPIIRRFIKAEVAFRIVHTGQHYDRLLDEIFFQDLMLPEPSVNLHAAAPTQGKFFGIVFPALEDFWATNKPSVVIVQGDTNSAFAGAFIADRLGIPVVHIEAGLRSDDKTMPEECNRILIDNISQRLYAPTQRHCDRLQQEGFEESSILITGNTVADAVREHLSVAGNLTLPFNTPSKYAVMTLHRPALVDHPELLLPILHALAAILSQEGCIAFFLIHPRTRKHLGSFQHPSIVLLDPIGYLPMLKLLQSSQLVITDSGGIQEEAALLQIPCVTIRENTERLETVDAGGNVVTGFSLQAIENGVKNMLSQSIDWKPVYTVDHPADSIVADLLSYYS